MDNSVKIIKNLWELERICKNKEEFARISKMMWEYGIICKNKEEFVRIRKNL